MNVDEHRFVRGKRMGVDRRATAVSFLLAAACLLCLPAPAQTPPAPAPQGGPPADSSAEAGKAKAEAPAKEPAPPGVDVSFEEKLLATVPEGVEIGPVCFGPDGSRVAYVARKRDKDFKDFLVVDGAHGKTYDIVGDITFSRDGKHVAYVGGTLGRSWFAPASRSFLVVDEVIIPDYYRDVWSLSFCPDSRQVAYVAKSESWKVFAVVAGKRIDGYDMIWSVVLSDDGKRLGLEVQKGHKSFVVIDGVEFEQFDVVSNLRFSPDGKRFAYAVMTDKDPSPAVNDTEWRMCVDGVKGEAFDGPLGCPTFSPRGQRVAYQAGANGKRFVVIDGVRGPPFPYVSEVPTFSHDGAQVAYEAEIEGKRIIIAGDRRLGEQFDSAGSPVFSHDGTRIAYMATQGSHWRIVVGNQQSEIVDELWGKPIFSPDSRRLAFGARKGRELWWKVLPLK